MVKIEINNNNIYELKGDLKVLMKLYKAFKVKNPNAFFLRKSGVMGRGWDGCIDYISETGKFKAGFFEDIINWLETNNKKYKVIDNRPKLKIKVKVPKKIPGQDKREYQYQSLVDLKNHEIGGIKHYFGVFDAATNAGKTTMMAGIHMMFRRKLPTIILLNDADLFEQFKTELPKLLPKDKIGFIRGKNIDFQHVTVVMVQTLSPKAKLYIHQLAKFGICLVDEADLGNSKTYKNIITHLFNCRVRVGLSGTIYMSKLSKDKSKNMDLKAFFGNIIFRITKKEMSELGYSTPVVINLWPGNKNKGFKDQKYPEEYYNYITVNKERAMVGVNLLKRRIKFGIIPALVTFQYIEHGEFLYKVYKKHIKNKRIELVSGKTHPNLRKKLLQEFKEGKIDILIASSIFRRGKNSPWIRYIQNMAGGDSQENVSQIMGRGERKHESKKKYYLDDFMDEGIYLKRHSNHRKTYYQKEGFKVVIHK